MAFKLTAEEIEATAGLTPVGKAWNAGDHPRAADGRFGQGGGIEDEIIKGPPPSGGKYYFTASGVPYKSRAAALEHSKTLNGRGKATRVYEIRPNEFTVIDHESHRKKS